MAAAWWIAALALGLAVASPARSDAPHPFDPIARVFQHPRCLNCHPGDNTPRNGDNGSPHRMKITGGTDGFGAPAARCAACHRNENNDLTSVPGTEGWRLAPRSMGWTGLGKAALCRAVKDQRLNGGLDLAGLVTHLDTDPRVLWGWDPGNGRAPVPIARSEFLRLFAAWVDLGGPCPVQ